MKTLEPLAAEFIRRLRRKEYKVIANTQRGKF
jgi:hypothetical protein